MLFFVGFFFFFLRPVNQDGHVKATKKTDGQTEDKKGEREKQEDVQKDRRRKKFK